MTTTIQWTDETWNPVVGCSPVSEGCRNCYAAREAIRLGSNPNPKISSAYVGTSEMRGAGKARRAVFTGKVNLLPDRLIQPLHWRKPRRVFVNSMSDLFHEDVTVSFIARVFAVMAAAGRHTFQILTKRPERMAGLLRLDDFWTMVWAFGMEEYWDAHGLAAIDEVGPAHPLPNVWLGTSVEDQDAADERIPHLLRTPAAVRFLSCEPLLGPLEPGLLGIVSKDISPQYTPVAESVDWVIVGGESGHGARPCNVAWVESIIEECRAASVPVFVKQLGRDPIHHPFGITENLDLSDSKGGDWLEWPEHLRVREFPNGAP